MSFFGAPLGWSFHRCSRAPYFLLHHSFSPLNANPSLFSASCFSVLSPFVHFETSHRRWRESQPVLPSPWLILANSVCFAFLISFCTNLQEEKTSVRRNTRLPLSFFFFFFSTFHVQSASHAFLINGLSVYGSKHVWILILERTSKEMFFHFCRKIRQKNPCSLWWIHFFVHICIYIHM